MDQCESLFGRFFALLYCCVATPRADPRPKIAGAEGRVCSFSFSLTVFCNVTNSYSSFQKCFFSIEVSFLTSRAAIGVCPAPRNGATESFSREELAQEETPGKCVTISFVQYLLF